MRFYGTNLQNVSEGTKVMIVLELCMCSLKSHIMSHPVNAPARQPDEVARRKVLVWAQQILDALRYVHEQGFVHQGLKLENVLVSSLCDYCWACSLLKEKVTSESALVFFSLPLKSKYED